MKKIIITTAILLTSYFLSAQGILLHKEVNDSVKENFGPNLRNFAHFYLGTGFIVGEPEAPGSEIISGASSNFIIGYRYKLRLTNWLAVGGDVVFNSYSFRLKQDSSKITPGIVLHDKEKLSLNNLGGDVYIRFNYGKRGNRIGNFIDLGWFGDLKVGARHYYKDKVSNGNIIQTTITHLNYFELLNYGALARIGFNRYTFYGYYRFSDLFKKSCVYPELPRITVGLQIGIHK